MEADRCADDCGCSCHAIDFEASYCEAKFDAVRSFERAYLTALMRKTGGNVSRASRVADIDRMHLHRLLQRNKIEPNAFRSGGTS